MIRILTELQIVPTSDCIKDKMKTAVVILNESGKKTGERLVKGLKDDAVLYMPQGDLSILTGKIFHKYDGLVFIMALGIVIRVIAPHIRNKVTDPAVVVVDDVGRYAISALSGHEGGANELAIRVANILGSEPVITTGSEARKDLIVGVGCRKGISSANVKEAIIGALKEAGCARNKVRFIATVDLKAKEKGLLDAASMLGIPIRIISREEIAACAKNYTKSQVVTRRLGIGGVCEPAALLGGRRTRLILKKKIHKGVTVAIARENFS